MKSPFFDAVLHDIQNSDPSHLQEMITELDDDIKGLEVLEEHKEVSRCKALKKIVEGALEYTQTF
jgi:hypothetical protein